MGWVWLASIGIVALGLLRAGGVRGGIASVAAAALLLGAAGYAVQQKASLAGSPATADARSIEVDPAMVAFRTAILPASAVEQAILAAADERIGRGDTRAAVDLLIAALARRPGSPALWTGLGSALVTHDQGQLSPAASLAFRRAIAAAPGQPGPSFFLGLAHLQSGDLAAAKDAWLLTLSLAPRDAPYRILIADRLVMIDRFMAMQAAAASAR